MGTLARQLPRCIFLDPSSRTGTAAPRFVPLRTTVLSTMDILLNQHGAAFTAAVVPALPDIAAAVKFPDAETRLAACSVLATVLHPPRIAAARRVPVWQLVREQLYLCLVCGGKADTPAEEGPAAAAAAAAAGGEPSGEDAREQRVRKALETVCLSVLVKLQAVPAARTRIPYRLFGIICNSEELQRLVADSDALENLISFIISEVRRPLTLQALPPHPCPSTLPHRRGNLRCLSGLSHALFLGMRCGAWSLPSCVFALAADRGQGVAELGQTHREHRPGLGGGRRARRRNGRPRGPLGSPLRLAAAAAAVRAAVRGAAVRNRARVAARALRARVAVPADGPRRDRRRPMRAQLRRCRDVAQPSGVCKVPAAPSADRAHCRCHGAVPLLCCALSASSCPHLQLADDLR